MNVSKLPRSEQASETCCPLTFDLALKAQQPPGPVRKHCQGQEDTPTQLGHFKAPNHESRQGAPETQEQGKAMEAGMGKGAPAPMTPPPGGLGRPRVP